MLRNSSESQETWCITCNNARGQRKNSLCAKTGNVPTVGRQNGKWCFILFLKSCCDHVDRRQKQSSLVWSAGEKIGRRWPYSYRSKPKALTIPHQRTWLCRSPLGVGRRILRQEAGWQSQPSWSPLDSPTGLLMKQPLGMVRHAIIRLFIGTIDFTSLWLFTPVFKNHGVWEREWQ